MSYVLEGFFENAVRIKNEILRDGVGWREVHVMEDIRLSSALVALEARPNLKIDVAIGKSTEKLFLLRCG